MTTYQFDPAFPPGVEKHFWTMARIEIVTETLRNAARDGLRSSQGRILDVGCGPGIVVGALREKGYDIWGVDLGNPSVVGAALDYVQINKPAQDLEPAFRESIETVILLDVIEHISDETGFLASLMQAFPNCRCVLVTVPARTELWSGYDEYFGHFRRYSRESLNRAMDLAHIKPVKTRYFFGSLYVAARLIKAMGRTRENFFRSPTMPFLHRLVARGLVLEDRIIGAVSGRGSSLISIAIPSRK
jgi:SAM-dependent methyltransferase